MSVLASAMAGPAARHALRTLSSRTPASFAHAPCCRRAFMSAMASSSSSANASPVSSSPSTSPPSLEQTPLVIPALSADAAAPQIAGSPPGPPRAERPKPRLRATKAAITMTPEAVARLQALSAGPSPKLIRIGVRNKGCAGLSYHLEYVDAPARFDEVVAQDGVRVIIDSKALFSIIGSEMDWVEDKLSAKFAFNNPNVKDACGCGESFAV